MIPNKPATNTAAYPLVTNTTCVANQNCELQDLAHEVGMDHVRFPYLFQKCEVDTSHKFFVMDHNRCIMCTRCVRVCDELEGAQNWERAAALLERALRIEPRNAQLWHRLAQVRLQQGQYHLAESLAQKSSALARDNPELQEKNTRLLKQARALGKEG